jgi:hypothetical protein
MDPAPQQPQVVVPTTSPGTKVDEWKAPVETALKGMIRDDRKYEGLITLLKETGSIISGGKILGAITKFEYYEFTDIDIYCPIQNMPSFLTRLVKADNALFDFDAFNKRQSSLYCKSFLKKNGIKRVYTFKLKSRGTFLLDVMSVRKRRSPLQVVTNFDLTFCQVWFDGSDVYASHPDHIRSKAGILQEEYVPSFLANNKFIIERIRKYIGRGFTIRLPEGVDTTITYRYNPYVCKRDTPDLNYWAKHYALLWLSGVRDSVDKNDKPILSIPQKKTFGSGFVNERFGAENIKTTKYTKHNFEISQDDGYDSEDIDEENLKQIALNNVTATENELVVPPIDSELIYRRAMTNLLINAYKTPSDLQYILTDKTFEQYDEASVTRYMDALKTNFLKTGQDFLGNDGVLFHLHGHPTEGAITAEGLEGYLQQHIRAADKFEVPCYWQPTPVSRGQPVPAGNCALKMKLVEIEAIVSSEFYWKFIAPVPIKTGLNQIVSAYDTTLENEKSEDSEGFGMIYHATMCPFCLQYEQRENGCAYMGHENPKRLPSAEHPYCLSQFVVKEMRDKYITAGRSADPDGFDHLEFCVECGRPCWNHQHFKLDKPGFVPNRRVPDARGIEHFDYGSCTGGGRPELYARILAVRAVHADTSIKNPKEERRLAALAADRAPQDPTLMARGRAIFEKEAAQRKWNNTIPEKKEYDDEAYSLNAEDHNHEEFEERDENLLAALEGQEGGRRKTLKQEFGKKTRRHRSKKQRSATRKN